MRTLHPLEEMFDLPAEAILDVIRKSNRLLVAVKGGVAQEHLRRYLSRLKIKGRLEDFSSIDRDGEPDFWVLFRKRKYLIECKNVQRTRRRDEMTVDFMRTRYAKTVGPEGRFYKPSEFHVLAACLYNQSGTWTFNFIPTRRLRRHRQFRGRLDNKVSLGVSTPYFRYWKDELPAALLLVK